LRRSETETEDSATIFAKQKIQESYFQGRSIKRANAISSKIANFWDTRNLWFLSASRTRIKGEQFFIQF